VEAFDRKGTWNQTVMMSPLSSMWSESVYDLFEEMLLQIQMRQFDAAYPCVKLAPASATKRSGSVWLRMKNGGAKCSVATALTAQVEVKSESKTNHF